MNKKGRLIWAKAFAGLVFFGFITAKAQNSEITIKIDIFKKEIITYVSLTDLPQNVDIIWQQKIPKEAHYAAYGNNSDNEEGTVIVMKFAKLCFTSSLNFYFVCQMDLIEEVLYWGESSLIYHDAQQGKRVVYFPAKRYYTLDNLLYPDMRTARSSENRDSISVTAISPGCEYTDTTKMLHSDTNIAATEQPTVLVIEEKGTEKEVKQVGNVEKKTAENNNQATTASIEQPAKVEKEKQKPVKAEKEKPVVQIDTMYCIQVFAHIKGTVLDDLQRNFIKLMAGHSLIELTREYDKYARYLVSGFTSKKDAVDKLEYYKQFAPDAFIKRVQKEDNFDIRVVKTWNGK